MAKTNGTARRQVLPMVGLSMRTEVMSVTPDMAAKWLTQNSGSQRTVSRHTVDKYAADMAAGMWELTHQAIAFNTTGDLVDGQHLPICRRVVDPCGGVFPASARGRPGTAGALAGGLGQQEP